MDLEGIVAAAKGRPHLTAQIYAASLLAIEVDTPAEREYMHKEWCQSFNFQFS